MPRVALIDADILCYEKGFASQQTLYRDLNGRAYESKADAYAECGKDVVLIPEIIPLPKPAALKMVRECISYIVEAAGADSYECYLTGDGNFREGVATIQEYKGNRSGTARPYHYHNIREYLIKSHGAIVVHGMEADDIVSIRQLEDAEEETIICSRDKDLKQIPGLHYSWEAGNQQEKKPFMVTEAEGNKHLFHQLLTGDNVDNILGCISIGPKKADKILADCETIDQMYDAVLAEYNRVYGPLAGPDGSIHYTSWDGKRMWKTPRELMEENYTLLYMLREHDKS